MNYYMVALNGEHLSHHGIKNQKWGVQNGPPYPLSRRSDGSLNRQKQDSRKRFTLGNFSIDALNALSKKAKAEGDEHSAALIKSVESSKKQSMEKAEAAKKKFDERSKENLGETIKKEVDAVKAARQERKEQRQREKDAARETEKRLTEEKARAAAADEKEALRQYIRHNPLSLYKYADAFTDEEMDDLIHRIDMDRKIKNVRDQELYRYKQYLETGASVVKTLANTSSDAIRMYNNCADVWNAVSDYKDQKAEKSKDSVTKGKILEGQTAVEYEAEAEKKSSVRLPHIGNNKDGGDKKDKQTFKKKGEGDQSESKEKDNDGNKKSPRDFKGFVDDDAAEQKAREKKDKKKQKQQDNQSQNEQKTESKTESKTEAKSENKSSSKSDVSDEVQKLRDAWYGNDSGSGTSKTKNTKSEDRSWLNEPDEADVFEIFRTPEKSSSSAKSKSGEEPYAPIFEVFTTTERTGGTTALTQKTVKNTYSGLSSNMDKENFWTVFNNVRDNKINKNDWTDDDEKNFQVVLEGMIDYYEDNLKHSGMDEDPKYGLPELKKYPMPDRDHVLSAIRFFNYVDPKNEKELAKAILARIREYGMELDDIGVGEENRFRKYIPEK